MLPEQLKYLPYSCLPGAADGQVTLKEFTKFMKMWENGEIQPFGAKTRFGFAQMRSENIEKLKARATPTYVKPPEFDADKAVEQIEEIFESLPGYEAPPPWEDHDSSVPRSRRQTLAIGLEHQLNYLKRAVPDYEGPPEFDADNFDDKQYEETVAALADYIQEKPEQLPGYMPPPGYRTRRESAEALFRSEHHIGYDTATMMRNASKREMNPDRAAPPFALQEDEVLYGDVTEEDIADWGNNHAESYLVLDSAPEVGEAIYEPSTFSEDVYLSTENDETPF
jgi:hypothetical protein